MPRHYAQTEEELEARMAVEKEKEALEAEKRELRKLRTIQKRKQYAALYDPRTCLGDPITGEACNRYAIPGAGFCSDHGGTTKAMQTAAKTRLLYMVEPALRVLNKCMISGDLNVALKAAQIILDRAGFHPHATLEIEEKPKDYSDVSTDDLIKRNLQLANIVKSSQEPLLPPEETEVIDMTEVEALSEVTEQEPKVH